LFRNRSLEWEGNVGAAPPGALLQGNVPSLWADKPLCSLPAEYQHGEISVGKVTKHNAKSPILYYLVL